MILWAPCSNVVSEESLLVCWVSLSSGGLVSSISWDCASLLGFLWCWHKVSLLVWDIASLLGFLWCRHKVSLLGWDVASLLGFLWCSIRRGLHVHKAGKRIIGRRGKGIFFSVSQKGIPLLVRILLDLRIT